MASRPGADPDQVGDVFGLTGMPSTTAAPITVSINVPGAAPAPDQTYISLQEPGSGVGPLYLKATVQGNVVSATLPPRTAVADSSTGAGGSKPQANSSMAAAGNQPQADAPETAILEVLTGLASLDSDSGNFQLLYNGSFTKDFISSLAKKADNVPQFVRDLGFGDTWKLILVPPVLLVRVQWDSFTKDINTRYGEWWGDVYFPEDTWGDYSIQLHLPQAGVDNLQLAGAKLGHLVMHLLQGRLRLVPVELAGRELNGTRPWLWMDEATASYFEWVWVGAPASAPPDYLDSTPRDSCWTASKCPSQANADFSVVRDHGYGGAYLIRFLSETSWVFRPHGGRSDLRLEKPQPGGCHPERGISQPSDEHRPGCMASVLRRLFPESAQPGRV